MIIVKGKTEPNKQKMMIYPKRYCVYLHRVQGAIIYIGKGKSSRPFEFRGRPKAWFAMTFDGYEIEVYGWYETDEEALKTEKQLIEILRPTVNRKPRKIEDVNTKQTKQIRQIWVDAL